MRPTKSTLSIGARRRWMTSRPSEGVRRRVLDHAAQLAADRAAEISAASWRRAMGESAVAEAGGLWHARRRRSRRLVGDAAVFYPRGAATDGLATTDGELTAAGCIAAGSRVATYRRLKRRRSRPWRRSGRPHRPPNVPQKITWLRPRPWTARAARPLPAQAWRQTRSAAKTSLPAAPPQPGAAALRCTRARGAARIGPGGGAAPCG